MQKKIKKISTNNPTMLRTPRDIQDSFSGTTKKENFISKLPKDFSVIIFQGNK